MPLATLAGAGWKAVAPTVLVLLPPMLLLLLYTAADVPAVLGTADVLG
jgi:hypothetical protein